MCVCANPQPLPWSGQPAGRPKAISPPLFLREGLAQFLLLLFGQVGRDDLEVVLPELLYDLVGSGRPTGKGEEGRGPFRYLVANLLYEVVADSNVRQRPRKTAHAGPDRCAKEGHEEDQPE